MPAPTINHRKVSALADDPTSDMSSGEWNDSLVIRGDGALGQLFQRDPTAPDGWSLTSTVTQTSAAFSTYVAVGATPAAAGAVRLANGAYVTERNTGNSGDLALIGADASNQITVGWASGAANPVAAGFLLAPSFNGLGVSGSTATPWTWTVINNGHLFPSSDNTFDLGDGSHRVRNGFFGTSVNVNTLQSLPGNNLTLAGIGATAGLLFYAGGANRWGINQVGTLYPLTDNAIQLGGLSNRLTLGYFSTAILLGTNPAVGGSLRLPNAGLVMARNAANTADLHVISVNSNNQLLLGDTAVPVMVYGGIAIFGTTATASYPRLQASGANLLCVIGDGSKYTPITCGELRAQVSSSESGVIIADTAFICGPSGTSTDGTIRMRNDGSIKFRNRAASGNLYLVSFGLEGSSDIIYLGSSGVLAVCPGAGSGLGSTTTPWPWITLGPSNPAQSGAVRLANGQSVNARNAANTGDIGLLRTNASDQVLIGGTTTWTAIRTLLSATPSAAAGFWWMEETGTAPNRQLRLAATGSDGVTYYQNIGTPH